MARTCFVCARGAPAAAEQGAETAPYEISSSGLGTYGSPSGSLIIKRLLDSANFGGAELDIAGGLEPLGDAPD